MTTQTPAFLSDDDLAALGISPIEVADAIEAALEEKIAGRLHVTPKSALMPGGGRYMMSTLAVGAAQDLIVLKQVSVCPDNPARGLPSINGAIMALDAQTGLLRAVLGANWITGIRTAALSHVAARRLADPKSSQIAFIGTGVQAHSHLAALASEFPLTHVHIFGRGQTNIDHLIETAQSSGMKATAYADPKLAVQTADIVVSSITLDYAVDPFVDANWLKPGAFAAITDLMLPWTGTEAFGTIVVDDLEQERTSDKPMVAFDRVATDLAGLAAGGPRFDPATPSAFAFRGIALGDYAATALALDRAESQKETQG